MADPKHLEILGKGVSVWNRWREDHIKLSDLPASLCIQRFRKVDLTLANLSDANLRGVNFREADLSRADLSDADLTDADLSHADLSETKLLRAGLENSDLRNANFVGADLEKADFRRAEIDNAKLSDANLNSANLFAADLYGAVLRSAKLRDADLRHADLSEADLSDADLSDADLSGAYLRGTDLSRACLERAILYDAALTNTILRETNLADANVGGTVFANLDLATVRGFESLGHFRSSTIGVDTILKSKALVPEIFLRRAGIPDSLVPHLKSFVGAMSPIEFYSCFISYSTKDQEFVDRLYADLQAKHVRCWFAPHDIQGGKKVHEQIDEAIRLHDRLLLILSPSSMKSEWVKTEIAKARKREVKEKRQVLFPMRLVDFETLRDWECFDADTGKDSAREIREYFIPDFSRWKDRDSYHKAFEGLMRDLHTKSERT